MRQKSLALRLGKDHGTLLSERKPHRLPVLLGKLGLLLMLVGGFGFQGLAQCAPDGFCQVGFLLVDFDTYLAVFGGNVGIGTTIPTRKLHVFDNGIFSGRFETADPVASVVEFRSGSSGATWEYGVSGSTSVFGLPPGSMYIWNQGLPGPPFGITPVGNVGIGTSNPQAKLHIAGSSWFTGDTTPLPPAAGHGIVIGYSGEGTGSVGYISAFDYTTFTPRNLALNLGGGNVGIGTANPDERLQVKNPNDAGAIIRIGGNSTPLIDKRIRFGDGDFVAVGELSTTDDTLELKGTRISMNAPLNVGIGTAFPTEKLHVVGTGRFTGFLAKAGGGFKIDHPLDPENKYLNHFFVESPEMKNVYDGVVVLDARGEAGVELPEWFEALNRDFRYQLTCIGGFAPVYIAEKVAGHRFKIAGGQPGLEVSWQVTGTRQDAWAKSQRIPVEEEKSAVEKGYYQNPEAHGQPETKSIEWARDPERMQRLREERESARKPN